MTNHPITPPPELVRQWMHESNHNEAIIPQVAVFAAQWGADQQLKLDAEQIAQSYQAGADQAAATLQHQWPKPITDRPPTEADGDEDGYVQYLNQYQRWDDASWHGVASALRPWFHTPHWRPKPPSLKEQALKALKVLPTPEGQVTLDITDLNTIRRALEQLND